MPHHSALASLLFAFACADSPVALPHPGPAPVECARQLEPPLHSVPVAAAIDAPESAADALHSSSVVVVARIDAVELKSGAYLWSLGGYDFCVDYLVARPQVLETLKGAAPENLVLGSFMSCSDAPTDDGGYVRMDCSPMPEFMRVRPGDSLVVFAYAPVTPRDGSTPIHTIQLLAPLIGGVVDLANADLPPMSLDELRTIAAER